MRIADLDFHLVEVSRTGQLPPVRSLLVRVSTDDGAEGWGEGAVSWRPSELLPRRDFILPSLAGRSIFDIEELQAVEALADPPLRAAVELACWDLVGKISNQPLCRLWGGEYRQRIPVAARLTGRWPARLAWMARELSSHGYLAQIIELTGEATVDRQIVSEVRETVGDSVQLRLDAHGKLSSDAARNFCSDVEGQQAQCLIDPFAARELQPLAALARQTNVPLGVWRAVRSPADLLNVVRCEAATHAIIDPEQLGGMAAARACAQIGAAAGLTLMLGSRPVLGLTTAAMLHLAAAMPGLTAAHESCYHSLSGDVLIEPLAVTEGMMTVPQCAGLGLEVDRAKIERYSVA
jgi:L-alanine-DL-glutamate epimerase-like enolase superfamily enzyme